MDIATIGKLTDKADEMTARIRKMYEPDDDTPILEIELFSPVAVSMCLYYGSDADEKVLHTLMVDLGRATSAIIAQEWKKPEDEVKKLYDARYDEYSELLADCFENPDDLPMQLKIIEALDKHVQGGESQATAERSAALLAILLMSMESVPGVLAERPELLPIPPMLQ